MAITRVGGSWIHKYVSLVADDVTHTYTRAAKPYLNLPNGSRCFEMDSDTEYIYDVENDAWEVYVPSGGGGGGTTNYNQLSNKPSINNVELSGNKTLEALGINAGSIGFDETETYTDGSVGKEVSDQKNAIDQLWDNIDYSVFTGDNLFDQNDPDVLLGQYYDGTTLKTASSLGQTGFIPVVPYCKYTSNQQNVFVQFYDANKEFILKVSSQKFISCGYVLAPYNASYARFIFTRSDINNFKVVKVNLYGAQENASGLVKTDILSANDLTIKVVACAIRKTDASAPWSFISDENHTPLNVGSISTNTKGRYTDIVIDYSFEAKHVISLIASPDETFIPYNIGASVGLSNVRLRLYDTANNTVVNPNNVYDSNGNFWVFGIFAV